MHFVNKNNFKLGILGGGQLGRMFIQEAINYGIAVSVMDADKNAPCAALASDFTLGDITNYDAVYAFGKRHSILTIEIENVNVDALEKLEMEGVQVFPQPAVLRMIKDKGLQKEFYREHAIPTSDFFLIENHSQCIDYQHELPLVQKLRQGGYDGKGVKKLLQAEDIKNAFSDPSVLEKFVPFQKEIAIIAARNSNGQIVLYPPVEMYFNPEQNLVDLLFSPADILLETANEAHDIAIKILEKTAYVGILAIEFFVTENGKLLVNEMAPRAHNSGHHTIEANYTSQYEQHLRAILNFPLGSAEMIQPAVMLNLLGEPGFEGNVLVSGLDKALAEKGVFLHLYGKKTTKPYRKMGHITVLNSNLDEAKRIALFVKKNVKVISDSY